MGLEKVNSPFHLDILLEKLEIEPKFEKLMWNWLEVLREENILEINGDLYVVREGVRELQTAVKEIQSDDFPDNLREKLKILTETMEKNIPTTIKILRGEDNILNILYKNEFLLTPKIAEEYNLTRIFMKEHFIRVFERIHETLDKDPVILELGNRMSGQTEEFLRILAGKGRYIYADESIQYMDSYKEKYGEKYSLDTLLFDFKDRNLYQGILKHSVDVIIADNTLHRTFDINRTLRNLKRLLRPGGILLIREFTNNSRLLLNTVALLEEGFHNLEDDRKTAGLPLIDAEQWVKLLKQQGFEWNSIISGEEQAINGAGECIIVAQLSHALSEFEEDRFYKLLGAKLPEYMLPDQVYDIEELPLTANGKVDRKILESYLRNETEKEILSPNEQLTELEQKVAQVWGEVLEHKVPSKFDNFFKSGGDSLKAIRFVNGLKEKHGIDVKLSWLFEAPDITSLSTMIQEVAYTNETCDEGEI
jgi:yersiniabactin nonribosomal peptide synthetase